MRKVVIGAGAGYSGDRIDPAVELVEKGGISYLVFECLAERTIALAQLAKRNNPELGYDPLLGPRMEAVLETCARKRIKIISNMGAANPKAAAAKTVAIANELGLRGLKIAAVIGDDVLKAVCAGNFSHEDGPACLNSMRRRIISANAYLGAGPIIECLEAGADVILTGRTSDPALFIAPLIHEFDWPMTDWNVLGQATVVGHLLECAGQLTGGYFADPEHKDVPSLAHLGFPLAEVSPDGEAMVTKVEGSGGVVNLATCKEQLLYEIQDPSGYVTPDVIANFSTVRIREADRDRVYVSGGTGRPRPEMLRASVGILSGYVGEGQISYAGPGAVARARLAGQVIAERISGTPLTELRVDLIGLNSILGDAFSPNHHDPQEVRLRVAGHSEDANGATMLTREIEALYTNGPAGGGGIVTSVRERVNIESVSVPRDAVATRIEYMES